MNEQNNSIPLDYNEPLEDESLFNKFDIVTDLGSIEHAFNVAEGYRTMHKLCNVNGLIIIDQSLNYGNGYYLYNTRFFEGIAIANNYKIIYKSYILTLPTKTENGTNHQFHVPANSNLLKAIDGRAIKINTFGIFQKLNHDNFKLPYQNDYVSQKQEHYGFNRLYENDGYEYYYAPQHDKKIDQFSFKELLSAILNKIF